VLGNGTGGKRWCPKSPKLMDTAQLFVIFSDSFPGEPVPGPPCVLGRAAPLCNWHGGIRGREFDSPCCWGWKDMSADRGPGAQSHRRRFHDWICQGGGDLVRGKISWVRVRRGGGNKQQTPKWKQRKPDNAHVPNKEAGTGAGESDLFKRESCPTTNMILTSHGWQHVRVKSNKILTLIAIFSLSLFLSLSLSLSLSLYIYI